MVVIDCSKRGNSGILEVCIHAGAESRERNCKPLHRLNFFQNVLVCESCWERYDIARFESHPDIEGKSFYEADEDKPVVKEYFRIYNCINTQSQSWCATCISEIQGNAGSEFWESRWRIQAEVNWSY